MTIALRRGAVGLMLTLAFAGAFRVDGAPNLVSGVVVDSRSHAPLANARVSLAPITARDRKLEQVTKQDGRFAFAVNEPGKYELQVTKPGYPRQGYKQATIAGVSSAIVVRDDQDTRHIVFEASRGSVITGQITDEDSEPVGNALVAVFQSVIVGGQRRVIGRGQRRANAAGEFRFSNLPRGNYYVCAMGRPWFADSLIQLQEIQNPPRPMNAQKPGGAQSGARDEQPAGLDQSAPKFLPDPGFRGTAFLTTFYPRAPRVEEASLVRLNAGSETQVSITLPLTKAVSVKGTLNVPGEMSDGRAYLLKKVYDQYVSFLEEWVQKDGAFQFKNVPAGAYEIVAGSQSGSGPSSWNIRQEVEVGTFDIELTLRPPQMASLSGRVLFDGERPASTANLFLSLRNEQVGLVRTEVSSDANFSLSRLPAGRYEVTAGNADYIAAYLTGADGKRLPLTLEITSGETISRDLTLTRAVSIIEGTVEKAAAPQIGAFVLLMPKDSSRLAYRVDQTDSDGSYHLATIPSGDYYLIALSDGEEVAYREAKVAAILTKAAKLVHVEPGDHLNLKMEVVDVASLRLPSL